MRSIPLTEHIIFLSLHQTLWKGVMLTFSHPKTALSWTVLVFHRGALKLPRGFSFFNLAGVERSTPFLLTSVLLCEFRSGCLNNLRLLVQFTFTLEE